MWARHIPGQWNLSFHLFRDLVSFNCYAIGAGNELFPLPVYMMCCVLSLQSEEMRFDPNHLTEMWWLMNFRLRYLKPVIYSMKLYIYIYQRIFFLSFLGSKRVHIRDKRSYIMLNNYKNNYKFIVSAIQTSLPSI